MQVHALPPLLFAAAISVVGVAVLLIRRPMLPRMTIVCLTAATLLLVLAAGDIHALLPRTGQVVVMVDLSPSTRSAVYRDRAALDARLKTLLGSRPYRLIAFAETPGELPSDARLADLPAVQTNFAPPDADAIVLLSDGRFDLPKSAPPTYALIDPGLIDPIDAAVSDVRIGEGAIDVHIIGRGPDRVLSVTAVPPLAVSPRETTVHRIPLSTAPAMGRAELSRADAWPENDALAFAPPLPPERQRWWISDTSAPPGWTGIAPGSLSTRPDDYLSPAVIALDNIAADDLPAVAQERLQQYVRDLGGSLLILGGGRAFAAGGYSGSVLDALSPLASDPPTPTTHWMLLTDASGSMAVAAGRADAARVAEPGGGTRWTHASAALATVVRSLPPADLVSVGSFASDLRWWVNGETVLDARSKPLPPPGVSPSGPTNLQPVLQKLLDTTPADLQKELLLLTDGETTIADPAALTAAMKVKRLRLHVLAIGSGAALPALRSIAGATGGTYTVELDAEQWLAAVRKVLRSATPDHLIGEPVQVRFLAELARLPARSADRTNRTWLKSTASPLAEGRLADATAPMTAKQAVGTGLVAAAAFSPTDAEREAIAQTVARPPRDPRFRMAWMTGKVVVDAVENDRYLTDLAFDLELRPLQGSAVGLTFTQTAPGRYEAMIAQAPQPRLAVVKLAGREIDRRPIPGRYAREFDAIGVDESALRQLADHTGGRVIGPAEVGPIMPKFWRDVSLTPWLSAIAAALVAAGLIHWKRAA